MKINAIVLGGIMIAVFILIGIVFNIDYRPIQTYIEAVKIIVIAVSVRKLASIKNIIVFLTACLAICLFVLPTYQTLIYNIPSMICGFVIGFIKDNKKIRKFLLLFLINTIMIVYEFVLSYVFLSVNLFSIYKSGMAEMLHFFNIDLNSMIINAIFVGFMVCDSVFSSGIIYLLSCVIFGRIDKIDIRFQSLR